jgi:hypothetical protein
MGAMLTGFCVILCLLGVSICYQITFALMMTGIPSNPLSYMPIQDQTIMYIYISGILVYPISCAKNVQFLSSVSLGALACLGVGICVLISFGLSMYGPQISFESIIEMPLWPQSLSDATSYVGIAVFCFGLCVICFPIEESMQNKHEFSTALTYCCIIVTVAYSLVGDVLSAIYVLDPNGINENILQNLPPAASASTILRIVMALVWKCIYTYVHVYTHVYIHMCIYTYVYTHITYTHTY